MLCLATGTKVLAFAVSTFTLSWTHSVQRTEWWERWEVTEAGIRPVEARVTSSGAGMEAPEGAVEEADGWHYVPHLPPQRQVFLGASGATVGGWTLCAGDSCQVVGAKAGAPLALWSDKDCSHPPETRP